MNPLTQEAGRLKKGTADDSTDETEEVDGPEEKHDSAIVDKLLLVKMPRVSPK
jgi:hypothetical protein